MVHRPQVGCLNLRRCQYARLHNLMSIIITILSSHRKIAARKILTRRSIETTNMDKIRGRRGVWLPKILWKPQNVRKLRVIVASGGRGAH